MLYSAKNTTEHISADIKKIVGEVPMKIDFEIQDEGNFLLVSLDFQDRPTDENLKNWCKVFKQHFSKTLPKPVHGYSWMIDITHNRWPIECVMDDIVVS